MTRSVFAVRRVVASSSSSSTFTSTVTRRAYAADPNNAKHREIAQNIAKSPVVLFMKGTPAFPQCGFSRGVVQVLNATDTKFDAYDVIADNELRNEIKTYSDWPTIPQLYINGQFVGGFDIVKTMFTDGSLAELLKQAKETKSPAK